MIRMMIGDRMIGITEDLLTAVCADALPAWITGQAAPTMQQAAIKSGIKAMIPMLLASVTKEIVNHGLAIPLPNLKCKEAKANMILYALNYFIVNGLELARGQVYYACTTIDDSTTVITGLTTDPHMAQMGTAQAYLAASATTGEGSQ